MSSHKVQSKSTLPSECSRKPYGSATYVSQMQ